VVQIYILDVCVYLAVNGYCCSWVSVIVTMFVYHSFFKLGLILVDVEGSRKTQWPVSVSCVTANRLLVTTLETIVY